MITDHIPGCPPGLTIAAEWEIEYRLARAATPTGDTLRRAIEQLSAYKMQLEWKPITEDSLPKVGDEVVSWASKWRNRTVDMLSGQVSMSYSTLREYGYTHYRSLNPPPAETEVTHEP
jgi:hypothetical protein